MRLYSRAYSRARSRAVARAVAWSWPMLVAIACSSSSSGGGGANDAGPEANTYASTLCGTCVATACAMEVQTCSGDPRCAQYLSCLEGCPADNTGDADATCAGACPVPSSGPGLTAQQAYAQCRQQGAGASCCTADGGSADGPTDGGGPGCTTSPNQPACVNCGLEKCCAAATACSEDADCAAVAECLTGCDTNPGDAGKYPCKNTCLAMHTPKGIVDWGTFYVCGNVQCSGPTDCNQDSCGVCVATSCGKQYTACFEDLTCIELFYCSLTCGGDLTCSTACNTKYSAGVNTYDSFVTCEENNCINQCGG